jgi:hypothetical protein
MDPNNGELLRLRTNAGPGDRIMQRDLERLAEEVDDLTQDEQRALEKLKVGEDLIRVSDDVAHAQAVGQKELARRKRRRRGLKGITGT